MTLKAKRTHKLRFQHVLTFNLDILTLGPDPFAVTVTAMITSLAHGLCFLLASLTQLNL